MVVLNDRKLKEHTGDGTQKTFIYDFKIQNGSQLQVKLNGTLLTEVTHYSIFGEGTNQGGNVTFETAPASGDNVSLERIVTLTQDYSFGSAERIDANAIENAFDQRAMADIQVDGEEVDAIRRPSTSTEFDTVLPDPATGAGKNIGIKSDGKGTEYVDRLPSNLATTVATNTSGIATNTSGLAATVTATTNNATAIATNTSGVSTNASGVSTNAAGLAKAVVVPTAVTGFDPELPNTVAATAGQGIAVNSNKSGWVMASMGSGGGSSDPHVINVGTTWGVSLASAGSLIGITAGLATLVASGGNPQQKYTLEFKGADFTFAANVTFPEYVVCKVYNSATWSITAGTTTIDRTLDAPDVPFGTISGSGSLVWGGRVYEVKYTWFEGDNMDIGISNLKKNRLNYRDVSANSTEEDESVVKVDCTGGSRTYTLENPALRRGAAITVIRKRLLVSDPSKTLTILPNQSSHTINGETSFVMTGDHESATFMPDGSKWDITAKSKLEKSVTITPSSGGTFIITNEDTVYVDVDSWCYVTLPPSVSLGARKVRIEKIDASPDSVKIQCDNSAHKIDNDASYKMLVIKNQSVELEDNGAGWTIVGGVNPPKNVNILLGHHDQTGSAFDNYGTIKKVKAIHLLDESSSVGIIDITSSSFVSDVISHHPFSISISGRVKLTPIVDAGYAHQFNNKIYILDFGWKICKTNVVFDSRDESISTSGSDDGKYIYINTINGTFNSLSSMPIRIELKRSNSGAPFNAIVDVDITTNHIDEVSSLVFP